MTAPLPLPATPGAYAMGCECISLWPRSQPGRIAIGPDCPLHSESARAARDEDRAQPVRLSGGAT